MKGRIIVAEDDPRQARIVKLYLENEGHSVVVAEDGLRTVEEVRRRAPDLLILDVMMPNLDGHDVCRIVRAETQIPILILTARSAEDDVLVGLDLGADDYVTKPYRPRELMARVRSLLRRNQRVGDATTLIEHADLTIDTERRTVRLGQRSVAVTASEFDILATLLRNPGRVFTRLDLMEVVMGFEHDSMERTIDAHVKNLRRKLKDDARKPKYIATVVGVGYRAPDDA